MAILLFVFFLIVFILMLVGSRILKKIKDAKRAVEEAADLKEQRLRNETGRQRQQYSQRQQPQNAQNSQNAQDTQSNQNTQSTQNSQSTESFQQTQNDNARRTETATGETIIDHHHENRENKKIFDDEEGEYVEFTEA
jgi:Flp pilus assembly protein TadG